MVDRDIKALGRRRDQYFGQLCLGSGSSTKAVLLTGDSKLRRNVQRAGVEVRGVLWVLDHLVDTGRLEPQAAAYSLTMMISAGAFLPEDQCARRIRHWLGRGSEDEL